MLAFFESFNVGCCCINCSLPYWQMPLVVARWFQICCSNIQQSHQVYWQVLTKGMFGFGEHFLNFTYKYVCFTRLGVLSSWISTPEFQIRRTFWSIGEHNTLCETNKRENQNIHSLSNKEYIQMKRSCQFKKNQHK